MGESGGDSAGVCRLVVPSLLPMRCEPPPTTASLGSSPRPARRRNRHVASNRHVDRLELRGQRSTPLIWAPIYHLSPLASVKASRPSSNAAVRRRARPPSIHSMAARPGSTCCARGEGVQLHCGFPSRHPELGLGLLR